MTALRLNSWLVSQGGVRGIAAVKPGWISPPDGAPGDYWVTRRAADAVGEYKLDLPDIRERFRWNGQAWVTGHYSDGKPVLCCMHTNNGWRFAGGRPLADPSWFIR